MTTEIIDAVPDLNGMDQLFAQALVAQARSEGVELIGPGGLLTGLTKSVLETALTGRGRAVDSMEQSHAGLIEQLTGVPE